MSFSNIKLNLFHLNINAMTLYVDIMPYFNKCIHVKGCNLVIFWSLKMRTPKTCRIANFGHPVSESWLSDTPYFPQYSSVSFYNQITSADT